MTKSLAEQYRELEAKATKGPWREGAAPRLFAMLEAAEGMADALRGRMLLDECKCAGSSCGACLARSALLAFSKAKETE